MNLEEIVVPFAEGPEKSVLSSILQDKKVLAKARAEGITEEHFHMPGRKLLFRRLLERDSRGEDNELVGLITALHASGDLDLIGGPAAVTEIYTYAPGSSYWAAHVKILREYLARRRAQSAALGVLEQGEDVDPADLTKALREATDATSSALEYETGVLTAKQAVAKLSAQMVRISESGDLPGISTSMQPIDAVTGGMRPGELWVVAAETSGGKSVWLLQATVSALSEGKRVLVVSLEMDGGVVVSRIACCQRSIPMNTFTHPRQAGGKWLQIAKDCLERLAVSPLSIHDRGGLTFDQIAGLARCESDKHGRLDLLVVDYLQLVEGGRRRRDETREQEMAGISRGLKALAKSLDCPVITASQMNEQGKMRESRAIGFDADVVLVVEEDGIRGAKIRNAERGQLFPLKLNGALQKFEQVHVQPEQQTEFRGY